MTEQKGVVVVKDGETALAPYEPHRAPVAYTPDQIELIKRTVAKGATDDELALFMAVARQSGLDPFTKQIHFVKRKVRDKASGQWVEVGTIQVAVDGYRAIAERTGTLAGIDDAVYDAETGPHPNKATVTVYRLVGGLRAPFTASARWKEYAQAKADGNLLGLWGRMPYLMLGKCAEALALRKAFPMDLSGLRADEEMPAVEFADGERAEGALPTWATQRVAAEQPKQIENPTGEVMSEAAVEAAINAIMEAAEESLGEVSQRGLDAAKALKDRDAYKRILIALEWRTLELLGDAPPRPEVEEKIRAGIRPPKQEGKA